MKARVKGTYEWLDFKTTVLPNTEFITEGYLCIKTGEVYKKEDLVFLDEYKDHLNVECLKPIDWQSIRIEAAMRAMQGALSNCYLHGVSNCAPCSSIAKQSVLYADALIEELKKENS